jgi:hypothetical protein
MIKQDYKQYLKERENEVKHARKGIVGVFLMLIILSLFSGENKAWELEDGVYVKYSFNPNYDCEKEFKLQAVANTVVRGCHTSIGKTHFVIIPTKDARDYECIRNHEFKHVAGWTHNAFYQENCR